MIAPSAGTLSWTSWPCFSGGFEAEDSPSTDLLAVLAELHSLVWEILHDRTLH
jgi:hypothetical protein